MTLAVCGYFGLWQFRSVAVRVGHAGKTGIEGIDGVGF